MIVKRKKDSETGVECEDTLNSVIGSCPNFMTEFKNQKTCGNHPDKDTTLTACKLWLLQFGHSSVQPSLQFLLP